MGKNKRGKKSNNLLTAGIALIAAAVVIIGAGIFMLFRSSDEKVITPGEFSAVGQEDSATACQNLMSDYYSAIMGGNGKALYQMMAPSEYWNYYMETYAKTESEIIATYDDAVKNTTASWKAECGNDAKVSFRIISSADMNPDFLKQWNDTTASMVGEGVLNAEEACTLHVTQNVTGSIGSSEYQNSPILIKINGKWYILDEGIE